MPRKAIDYSNTVVYMICCKDPTITDVYVGHTTSLSKRKCEHKSMCSNVNNNTTKRHNIYVYQFIREHGGWENWEIIVLETVSCVDGDDARKLERKWLEEKKATLNKKRPIISKEEELLADRQYYQENEYTIVERHKIYYQENKDVINKKNKLYYQENKEVIKEQKKIYRQKKLQNNKDV
jgi:hypothetical protein